MHIFISYGRGDKEAFAKKLAAWLRERGHEPWLDVEHGIPPGHPFDVRIEEGIQENEILLAVLSPWSVRPESFCRNEILYAQTLKKTVLPVRMADVIPPIQIISLNYVDASTRPDDVFTLLDEALETIRNTGTWQPYTLPAGKQWYESGEEIDFHEDLVRFGTGFVGREWLFEELRVWVHEPASRVCLIVADVGIGKSAIAAQLTAALDVKGVHFCTRSAADSCKPVPWIRTLIRQLARQFPAYRESLDTIPEPNWAHPPASLFRMLVSDRLTACRERLQIEEPWVFAIDSLDEADPAMVTFFTETIDRIPPWIRLVLTSRPDETILARFALPGVQERRIRGGDSQQRRDVDAYLEKQYQVLIGAEILPERSDLLERFTHLSDGNFHYASVLIDALNHPDPKQRLQIAEIGTLPGSLGGLYDRLFRRRFGDVDRDDEAKKHFKEDVRPLLDCLTAAPAPVPESLLVAVAGREDEGVAFEGLSILSQFLIHEHGAYRLFHESVREWLTENRVGNPFAAYPSKGHRYFVEAYTRVSPDGWASGPDDGYFLQHLCGHLVAAGREDQAIDLLLDATWIERSVNAGLIYGLIEAYNLVLTRPDGLSDDVGRGLRLIQGALRLSQHVLAPHPEELPSQLHGRLLGIENSAIEVLLEGLRVSTNHPWLRPITPSLISPEEPLHQILIGHRGPVLAVAVTPDGHWIISGSDDKTIKIWDLESGREIRSLEGHTGSVLAVAVTSDGQYVVSGSSDRTVRVWDIKKQDNPVILGDCEAPALSVAVTPNGNFVISGAYSNKIKIWDLESREEKPCLNGYTDWVWAVTVTPDGFHSISGSRDGKLRVWDLRSWEKVRTLTGHLNKVNAIAVAKNGRYAISGSSDKTLRIWDLLSWKEIANLEGHTDSIYSVAITPDNLHAVSGSKDGSVRIWDIANQREIAQLRGHTDRVNAVAVTPDGKFAVSGAYDNTLIIWDIIRCSKNSIHAGLQEAITAVKLTPDGQHAITGHKNGTMKIWDLATGQRIATLAGHTSGVIKFVVTPDGRHVISGSEDKTLIIWDLITGEKTPIHKAHDGPILTVTITPNGRYVITGSKDKDLKIWDIKSGRKIGTLRGHSGWVVSVFATPGNKFAVSGSVDKTLKVWDLSSREDIETYSDHISTLGKVLISPDGLHLVSRSTDGQVTVRAFPAGVKIASIKGHAGPADAVAITPDGHYLISGSFTGIVTIWDLYASCEIKSIKSHDGSIMAVAVTSDGRYALTGSVDNTLKVWDIATGTIVTSFSSDGIINSIDYSDFFKCIIAGDEGGNLHILKIE